VREARPDPLDNTAIGFAPVCTVNGTDYGQRMDVFQGVTTSPIWGISGVRHVDLRLSESRLQCAQ
jgi:hypothetical protein